MRFFAKIVFVFNTCFLVTIPLRLYELNYKMHNPDKPFTGALPLRPLESTLVVLGYSAIFINLCFLVWVLIMGKRKTLPQWLFWFNAIIFIIQVYYFFFSRF